MLSFSRFLISLVVIVAVFCVAWMIGEPKNQSENENGDIVLNSGSVHSASSESPGATTSSTGDTENSGGIWDRQVNDLSKIAIVDPFANQQGTAQPEKPEKNVPQTAMKPVDENTGWNAGEPSKPESLVIDPPPLVGDFQTDSDQKNQHSDWNEQPDVPSLLSQKDSDLDDPNAPPRPIQQTETRSVESQKQLPSVVSKMPSDVSKIPTRISGSESIQKRPGTGKQFVGELVVVEKKQLLKNKPIGFVKHVWKHGDSLPELAEVYLNDKNRFMEIVAINGEDISNPTKIPIGTVLKIPVY